MQLDPRTMIFVLALGGLLMAVGLIVVSGFGTQRRALRLWVASNLCFFAAWSLFFLRDRIPDVLSIIVANAALLLGYALQFAAISDFLRRSIHWLLLGTLVIACTAVHVALYAPNAASSHWRIIFASLAVAGWLAACAIALFTARGPERRRTYRLTASFYALAAAADLYRGLDTAFSNNPTPYLMTPTTVQSFAFAIVYVSLIGASFGFILMVKERSDVDLVRLASLDALTSLPNRHTFVDFATRELSRSRRRRYSACVLMMDLDHFKIVNDTHGHLAGDQVLQHFARVLKEALRPVDLVGRYGGEEFCVLLPETRAAEAYAIAERIRTRAESSAARARGGAIAFTVSIGIAEVEQRLPSLEEALARADRALYEAKACGRNCVAACAPGGRPRLANALA